MEMPGYGYGMMNHHQQQQQQQQLNYHNNDKNNNNNNNISSNQFIRQQYVAPQPAPCSRKRKADAQPEHERLSKRMSLLNLEHGGHRLYVSVGNPQAQNSFSSSFPSTTTPPTTSPSSSLSSQTNQYPTAAAVGQDDTEFMQVDNTKHKVYIYNIEDELSSESEAEQDGGKLIFLPDIESHLRQNRIPAQVLSAQPLSVESDILNKQLVLYSVPASLTVPEEQDSVRKAILEARARIREKHLVESQQLQQQQMQQQVNNTLTDTVQIIHPGSLPQFDTGAAAGDEVDDDAMELD
ncbi:uncharacterized protein B0T23DRAFT_406190 [Neurospora hispaniola]|uniref:Uncharacterized protein n=1 Tax=Neurospora hispaniola TaxID=588809 RepID=A0AAJ0I3J4_9PEZI|nr:hypothetical protein B0T23DRAFT_406190 [Neurospora hispaniola]